ncbi:MAG: class I SAM-dependent methyltransferase [Akkermansiaceae bacterium]|jgi:SAM-dependent methyltransferase|nr:class I SAM-dependent methyltransferase [Akkermansiaceae bacterium]
MKLEWYHPEPPFDPRAEGLLPGVGGFPPSDRHLFLAGYTALCHSLPAGGRALEICGGFGKLAAALAKAVPDAEVIGLDLYAASGSEVDAALAECPGLSYVAGDAFDLGGYPEGHFDLVFGQAALHHLAHDIDGLRDAVLRVIKPGGKLVFVFEPLGHNPWIAAIRAWRFARAELGDESNLFAHQFERLGQGFSRCEVQSFNLLGYPMKAASDRFGAVAEVVQTLDHRLMRWFPGLHRMAANCNLVFTK